MKYELAIIGAGSWGTALGLHLARKNIPVCLWDNNQALLEEMQENRCNLKYLPLFPFPQALSVVFDFEQAIEQSKDVLIAVPSFAFSDIIRQLSLSSHFKNRLAWVTKGIDPHTNNLLHTVVEKQFSKNIPFAILSGPSFAAEVAADLPTAITIASNDLEFQKTIIGLFHTPRFRLYPTQDYIGVELGGAVKNVLAIAAGISDGLGYGTNTRAALITRGLAEMIRLGKAMGAKAETFMGLSGLGDLVLTCTDTQSRNRRFGLALGKNIKASDAEKTIGQAIEGKDNARQLYQLAKQYGVEMPVAEQVWAILSGQSSPEESVQNLLTRPVVEEK